ncbi:hypothetical protein [Klebsiella pneumoniae]|uniref:hypothetical protein n=1 Tax=Klebsiella pneumoniae TaxID=573 RepID=UPI001378FCC1|nr:hypothetical protein [Klebsiella pneumoniae]
MDNQTLLAQWAEQHSRLSSGKEVSLLQKQYQAFLSKGLVDQANEAQQKLQQVWEREWVSFLAQKSSVSDSNPSLES